MITIPYQKPLPGCQLNRSHPLAKGLVGCWLINERGGNRVTDVSRKIVGTFANHTSWSACVRGSCLSMDGTDDYVDTNSPVVADTDPCTFICWVKNKDPARSGTYIGRGLDSFGNGWSMSLGLNWDGYYFFRIVAVSGGAAGYDAYGIVPAVYGTINMVCGVFIPGKEIDLYINGVLEKTTAVAKTTLRSSTVGVRFGGAAGVSPTAYCVDNIISSYIYNRCLSHSEILSLYQSPYAMFQPSRIIVKAPAAGGGWKPAWAARNRRTIGLGVI